MGESVDEGILSSRGHRVTKLMKSKTKGKNFDVFYFAGKTKYFAFIFLK